MIGELSHPQLNYDTHSRPSSGNVFLRHMRPDWNTHSHHFAPQSGGGEHKLKLFAGWVTGYESNVDHVSVHLRRCGAGSEESIEVSAVINCPRPAFDLRQLDAPLLTSLRTGGLLVSDALETSMEIASSGALVGRDGTESHWLLRQPLPPDTRLGNHGST